ncbi:hypothetical protein CEXT_128451 [Caerostris extrusa]|uniref:Uncharacterized protein n=1 Tax=Caerostris extrusa TaxID=172846 RepID=A0AAV4S7V4_CAEEX|nr:hypothetical protein CEXT_128451 [Caerostris extrusa]
MPAGFSLQTFHRAIGNIFRRTINQFISQVVGISDKFPNQTIYLGFCLQLGTLTNARNPPGIDVIYGILAFIEFVSLSFAAVKSFWDDEYQVSNL